MHQKPCEICNTPTTMRVRPDGFWSWLHRWRWVCSNVSCIEKIMDDMKPLTL